MIDLYPQLRLAAVRSCLYRKRHLYIFYGEHILLVHVAVYNGFTYQKQPILNRMDT